MSPRSVSLTDTASLVEIKLLTPARRNDVPSEQPKQPRQSDRCCVAHLRLSCRSLAVVKRGADSDQGAICECGAADAADNVCVAQEKPPSLPAAALRTGQATIAADALTRPHWNGWGVDIRQHRFQPADMARLADADVPKLKLKWAFGIPGVVRAFAQPTVVVGDDLEFVVTRV
jgi:hypothetical protein